ncbi:MAG TPA: hypothetical protein VHO07_27930 [Streptosporangiaceae bacterium]|jgi:hypothetical protein|nr:hypothetical protein [Streptosporangiaceae bacterium]
MTRLRGNPWAVLVVVSLGFFMTLLDLTIVNIGLISGSPAGSGAQRGLSPALAAQLQRLAGEVFTHGYVLAMRWTMVMPIAVVVLAAVSCLWAKNRPGQGTAAAPGAHSGQLAVSSPGPSGQSPGSSPGRAS